MLIDLEIGLAGDKHTDSFCQRNLIQYNGVNIYTHLRCLDGGNTYPEVRNSIHFESFDDGFILEL